MGFHNNNGLTSIAGYRLVYCRYITRNGKRIYPKRAKFFRFWVKKDRHAKRNDQ